MKDLLMTADGKAAGYAYNHDPALVHVKHGERVVVGHIIAAFVDATMRLGTTPEGTGAWVIAAASRDKKLCPGCYMTVLVNAAIALAKANGQSLEELGTTLSHEFAAIADGKLDHTEEVVVRRKAGG